MSQRNIHLCYSLLELLELLLGAWCLADLQNIKADSLGKRAALTHSHNVSRLNIPETG